jgi:hypothetical protein
LLTFFWLADWIALADLVNCIPSLRLSFEDHFRSSYLPPSFVLSLRQHSFDLHLTFAQDVNPNAFLSLLSQQTTQSHTPPIDPFAIASLDFTFIPVADVPMLLAAIPALARLGRTGPEGVYFQGTGRFDMRAEALGKVTALMGRNLWLQWVDWGTHVGMVMESEPVERVKAHNRQTLNLRNGTREAALILLTAARTLLCSFPIPSPEPLEPSLLTTLPPDTLSPDPAFLACSSRPTLVSDLQSFSTLIALSSDPSTSNFPILSVPYELLDLILSYLSSGFLSSNQHRLVMNWAEDRSTLGINKVDSRTDFLRKTNCWRWESEVEMVNLGHAHE